MDLPLHMLTDGGYPDVLARAAIMDDMPSLGSYQPAYDFVNPAATWLRRRCMPTKKKEKKVVEEKPFPIFSLPRELRDIIWSLCVHDYESRTGNLSKTSVTTKIIFSNAPLRAMQLINRQIRKEYNQAIILNSAVSLIDRFVREQIVTAPILIPPLAQLQRFHLHIMCICLACEASMQIRSHCCVEHELKMHYEWIQAFANGLPTNAIKEFEIRMDVTWPTWKGTKKEEQHWPLSPWDSAKRPIGFKAWLERIVSVDKVTRMDVFRWKGLGWETVRGLKEPTDARREAQGNRDLYVRWERAKAIEEAKRSVDVGSGEYGLAKNDWRTGGVLRSKLHQFGWVPGSEPEAKPADAEADDDADADGDLEIE